MPTTFGTYNPGDTILDTHIEAFNAPINNLETGASYYAVDGGSTDAYAVTMAPVPTSYTSGMLVHFKANTANTGPATLNVNGLGAKTIKRNADQDLLTGDIAADQIVAAVYDGTNFQLLGGERVGLKQAPAAGRLDYNSTTQVRLNASAGQYLDVNDELVVLDGTTSGCQLATTDNQIDSAGDDAAAAMSASTLYYVYRSNSSATTFPNDLRASTSAPVDYRGSKYLAASGNGANWRFVGYVHTDGSTEFTMDATKAGVVSFLNKKPHVLRAHDGTNSWTAATANTWKRLREQASPILGQTSVGLISDGVTPFEAAALMLSWINGNASTNKACISMAVDWSSGSPSSNAFSVPFVVASGASGYGNLSSKLSEVASEGYHVLDLLQLADLTGSDSTFYGDGGFTSGELQTGMEVIVWV